MFGCTNTTLTDRNGEPEGDVVFVNTDCTTNERLVQGQDPRYYSLLSEEVEQEYAENTLLSVSNSDYEPPFQRQDPDGDETCFRACLCGHVLVDTAGHNDPIGTPLAPYQVCKCSQMLAIYYYKEVDVAYPKLLFFTSANMTLLKYYGILPCDARVGQSGNFTGTFSEEFSNFASYAPWVGVPDNDSMIVTVDNLPSGLPENTSIADMLVKNNYECFDNFDNMQSVVFNYVNQSYDGGYDEEPKGVCG